MSDVKVKKPRGFAAMTPEKRKAIAAKGGAAVPPEKRTFANRAFASSCGRKGGMAPHDRSKGKIRAAGDE